MKARVAVCIPAFDVMRYLGATLDSVLAQSFADWEVVIVDDASNDDTVEVAEKFSALDDRITVLHNDTNLGAAANWNRAVAATTAPLVKVLCGDDILYPTCLERQVAAFDADPAGRFVMVASRRDIVGADGGVVVHDRGLPKMAGAVASAQALRQCVRHGTNVFGEPSQVLLRRDALERAGGFDGHWRYMLDVDCCRRVLRYGDLMALSETLGAFRYRPEGWSAALAHQQAGESRVLLRELRRDSGGTIGLTDALLGAFRAEVLQIGRRALLARMRRATRV